jgi:hypothetical protein
MQNQRPSQAILRVADQIRAIVRAHRAKNPRVFGSVARGDDTENSDVDLLVDPAPAMSLLDLIRIEREVRALLSVRVEVFTPSSLRASARASALREARAI